jgi:RNA polymerase sigma-70 factor (ECF subfamily)
MFFNLKKKSDEQLMQLITEGNSRALTELYERYSVKMLRYFFRMLWKDKVKAEDFLQDLFIKIIEQPRHFNGTQKFSTWIYSVANNMCKNEYRKKAFRDSVNINDLKVASDVTGEISHGDEIKDALENALTLLSEEEKHLYSLRYEVDLPLEEIAALENLPVGTIKSRLFYLKKKLADALTAQDIEKVKYG